MKKNVIFLMCFIFGFMMCSFLHGEPKSYLIYQFRASFKRLEPVSFVNRTKYEDVPMINLSYKITSDSFTGYLVVPNCCDECYPCFNRDHLFGHSTISEYVIGRDEEDITANLYIRRRGEKNRNDRCKIIKVKLDNFNAGVFGQGFNTIFANHYYIFYPKDVFMKLRQSYMNMNCSVSDDIFDQRVFAKGRNEGTQKKKYGLLGYTSLGGTINMSGFGSVIPNYKSTNKIGWCETVNEVEQCMTINKISGSLIGQFEYESTKICESCPDSETDREIENCIHRGIIDPCSQHYLTTAPIVGTWTVNLNKSKSSIKYETYEDLEADIEKWERCTIK